MDTEKKLWWGQGVFCSKSQNVLAVEKFIATRKELCQFRTFFLSNVCFQMCVCELSPPILFVLFRGNGKVWVVFLNLQCMGWLWYLAADMQFYIISSFVILLMYRWVRSVLTFQSCCFSACVIATKMPLSSFGAVNSVTICISGCRSTTKGCIAIAFGLLSCVAVTAALIGIYDIDVNLARSITSNGR